MRTGFHKSSTPSTSPSRYSVTPSSSPSRYSVTPPRSPSRYSITPPRYSVTPPRSPRHTFSQSLMEENIEIAESLITKWDYDSSSYANVTTLFRDDRYDAKQYLKSVKDLQTAMKFFASEDSSSEKLVVAQNLMQTAMKRLQKEFYQILSANRESLNPESVSSRSSRASAALSNSDFEEESEDDLRFANEPASSSEVKRVCKTAMADLKAIADCMISSGYVKECVKVYNLVRKSIIDEGLYHLGVEKLSFSQVQKMDWEVLEKKIKNWLNAVKTAVRNLFNGERILCDHVLSASAPIGESCFSGLTKEGAMTLFGFPELVAKQKKTPEKIFLTLDLYEAISNLWPEIESIFSFESTSAVRLQAVTSLTKLGESVRSMLTDFETAIQKDASKTPVPSGGVHPLTRYVMNYLIFLTDYSGNLADILADWPLTAHSPLPESYFGSPEPNDSPITVRFAWLLLVLLCKLDGKAELYKDVALSYIFLANNLQYVVVKVRTSNLKLLIGDDWIANHESKVKQYASNYERMGWSKVFSSLPEDPTAELSPEVVSDCFRKFNTAFEEAYRKQASWIVSDAKLRDGIKISLAKKIGPLYGEFYEKYRAGSDTAVRFHPDDIGNYLSDLFYGAGGMGSVSVSSS